MADTLSTDNETDSASTVKHGQAIVPGAAAPTEAIAPDAVSPSTPTQSQPTVQSTSFAPFEDTDSQPAVIRDNPNVSWTASEFIAHEKSISWYAALSLVTVVIAFLVWLFTKSIFSAIVVVLCGGILGYFGSHKPRQLHYQLNADGLTIEQKLYSYNSFMSFSIVPEGAINSIVFMPTHRFMPPLSIYYDPADEQEIVGVLSARVPLEPGHRDVLDRIVARIRF
jgi:hypothetical protein